MDLTGFGAKRVDSKDLGMAGLHSVKGRVPQLKHGQRRGFGKQGKASLQDGKERGWQGTRFERRRDRRMEGKTWGETAEAA